MTPERWQLIEKLYHDSQDRTLEERATWLAEVCADDETLRREVEVLLAANEQASHFLNTPAIEAEARQFTVPSVILPSGEQFGHYHILSQLGVGGMGEVYLARDLNLERKVALKVLPPHVTTDLGRLHRFVREAKTASALNHPNIITIYEIGQNDNLHFIATEYIEGVTLRQRLQGGKLELRAALEVARQVAAALDTAHRAGIIHRDIKPENIMLRPDGLVKVLDFGLAKLTEDAAPSDPHLSTTMPGLLLGTPRYMSPEQARRQKLDARSDIFSFGEVLYEMVTGQPPFTGATMADLFAAILSATPLPLTHYDPDAPAELQQLLTKAMAKDYGERYQTMHELQRDLQALSDKFSTPPFALSSEVQTLLQATTQGKRQTMGDEPARQTISLSGRLAASLMKPALKVSPLMIGAVLIAFAGWQFWRLRSVNVPRPTPRITKLLNERITSGGNLSSVEFSPDGKLIAYALRKENESHLLVKQVAGTTARQITDGQWRDRSPIWSPDGQRLAFLSDRGGTPGIWGVGYFGDTPSLLKAVEIEDAQLLKWSRDAAKIYYEWRNNLHVIELNSGQSTQLTDFADARQFRLSPDEEKIAYTHREAGKGHIWVAPLSGEKPTQITTGDVNDRFPAWFPDSRRLAFSSNRSGQYQIYTTRLDGAPPEQIIFSDDDYSFLSLSPDGTKMIALTNRQNANLFSAELPTGQEMSHTGEFGLQLFPQLSPNQ